MERDPFSSAVYCLVCTHDPAAALHGRVRHGGFAPALRDEEVRTIEIGGAVFTCGTAKDIFASLFCLLAPPARSPPVRATGGPPVAGQRAAAAPLEGGQRPSG